MYKQEKKGSTSYSIQDGWGVDIEAVKLILQALLGYSCLKSC